MLRNHLAKIGSHFLEKRNLLIEASLQGHIDFSSLHGSWIRSIKSISICFVLFRAFGSLNLKVFLILLVVIFIDTLHAHLFELLKHLATISFEVIFAHRNVTKFFALFIDELEHLRFISLAHLRGFNQFNCTFHVTTANGIHNLLSTTSVFNSLSNMITHFLQLRIMFFFKEIFTFINFAKLLTNLFNAFISSTIDRFIKVTHIVVFVAHEL